MAMACAQKKQLGLNKRTPIYQACSGFNRDKRLLITTMVGEFFGGCLMGVKTLAVDFVECSSSVSNWTGLIDIPHADLALVTEHVRYTTSAPGIGTFTEAFVNFFIHLSCRPTCIRMFPS